MKFNFETGASRNMISSCQFSPCDCIRTYLDTQKYFGRHMKFKTQPLSDCTLYDPGTDTENKGNYNYMI